VNTLLIIAGVVAIVLLLVGGFSQIPYVHQRIAQHLNGRAIVAVSTRALVDVVEGAVRFAYNPKVRSRRAQYTYGVGICKPFRRGVDKKHKRFHKSSGEEYCRDRFAIFVRSGELVPVEDETPFPFCPIEDNQDTVTFRFYRTSADNPTYIDDPGCQEFASCEMTVKLNQAMGQAFNERGIKLYVNFGETELKVRAVVNATGEQQFGTLRFSTR